LNLSQMSLDRGLGRRRPTPAPRTEKIAAEHGFTGNARCASIFKSFKSDFLQAVPGRSLRNPRGARFESLNPRQSAVDHASEFGAEFGRTAFPQTLFRSVRGKPGGVSIRFLRRFESGDFAKMGSDGKLWLGKSGGGLGSVCLATEVTREGDFLHPAMNASLFESLESGGLGVGEAAFDPSLGENPASAAGLDQQEFNATSAHAVTDGGDLLAFFQKPLRKLLRKFPPTPRRSRELYG
jgi:hypothetical protein